MDFIILLLFLIMVIGVASSSIWFLLLDDKSEYNAVYLGLLALFITPYLVFGAFVRYFSTHGYSETLDKISGDIVFWTIGAVIFSIITFGTVFLYLYVKGDDKSLTQEVVEHKQKVNQRKAREQRKNNKTPRKNNRKTTQRKSVKNN